MLQYYCNMKKENRTTEIEDFVKKNVESHPQDIVLLIAKTFNITRQTAHYHVKRLIKKEIIIKTGDTRGTRYFLANSAHIEFSERISSELDEDDLWKEFIEPKLKGVPENVLTITRYAFTEMVNNAIDHSMGERVVVTCDIQGGNILIDVLDDGVGVFESLRKKKGFATLRESVLHLSKGKFTTDPVRHSGEGIFFTSRAVDRFSLLSSHLMYAFFDDGNEDDWLIQEERDKAPKKGTFVRMVIPLSSQKKLQDVFGEYTSADDDKTFSKTTMFVKLSKDDDMYISRSQARRLLVGAEKFKKIVLDFRGVKSVGQGFVDQVFRVFQSEHPDIEITYTNASKDVEFMVKHSGVKIHPS